MAAGQEWTKALCETPLPLDGLMENSTSTNSSSAPPRTYGWLLCDEDCTWTSGQERCKACPDGHWESAEALSQAQVLLTV